MLQRVLQSEAGNSFAKWLAGHLEPVSNDRFLGDLNLKTDIFSVHDLLFTTV